MPSIRRAISAQDDEHILTLHEESFVGGREECPSLYEGAWWLAFEDREPVAFAGVHPSKRFLDTVYLCRAGVAEQARGFGLQKKLIYVREAWARKEGYVWVVTDSAVDNPASSNSLINCGYKLFIPKKKWASYRPALYWRKRLQK